MKIIILQDIKGIGKKFDIKDIKDGFARNFLIPKGLVKIATDKSIKELEIQKAAREKEEQEIKVKLETLAENLSGREFQFTIKTGKKGEVFGSINKDDIKTRIYADLTRLPAADRDLREHLKDIEINLEKPIKILGEHWVEINLGRGIKAKIKLKVLE